MVSVIIPNYCHARYLKERIDTILSQTYQDFEIILLDDCSTDNSREIIEQFRSHPKVSHIVYNEHNSGSPFKQWQKGMALAQGEYVWIAESDDFSSPYFLERCTAILDRHPHCAVAFTSSYIADGTSQIVREQPPIKEVKEGYVVYRGLNFLYRFLCPRCTIYNSGMALVRRSAIPDDDRYTRYRYSGDWFFWMQMALHGDVAYLSESLNYYRDHGHNVSCEAIATGRRHFETQQILNELFTQLGKHRAYRLSMVGRHFLRIKQAAGAHWNEEPFLSIRQAWTAQYRFPMALILWYKIYKIVPRH